MMKALKPVTLFINLVILLQDDIFMRTGFHLLRNILVKNQELNIIWGTIQNWKQIICPNLYHVRIPASVMDVHADVEMTH